MHFSLKWNLRAFFKLNFLASSFQVSFLHFSLKWKLCAFFKWNLLASSFQVSFLHFSLKWNLCAFFKWNLLASYFQVLFFAFFFKVKFVCIFQVKFSSVIFLSSEILFPSVICAFFFIVKFEASFQVWILFMCKPYSHAPSRCPTFQYLHAPEEKMVPHFFLFSLTRSTPAI
jgi:hypothetical protein